MKSYANHNNESQITMDTLQRTVSKKFANYVYIYYYYLFLVSMLWN